VTPLLTADRVRAAANVWCVAVAAGLAGLFWFRPDMQAGRDFGVLWIAGRLAWEAQIAGLYGAMEQAMVAAMFGPVTAGTFYYPPVALLLFLPFGFLPFPLAVIAWVCATGAAFAAAVRGIAGRGSILVSLAWPAALICALYGQNGLLLAALMGAAALTLNRFPVLAGVAIGCLIYKPHLAVLAPLALALTGRWRAFLAAGATAALLIAASVLAFGLQSWEAFAADLPAAQALYANGVPGFAKFASPYTALRLLGATATIAWVGQASCAAAAVAFLIWAARRAPDGKTAIAAMVAATGFCVPFLGEYDLPVLAIPGAWIVSQARRSGWLPYEQAILIVLYLAPFAITVASEHGIPLAPLAVGILLFCIARRMGDRRAGRPV
jgi:alpha-1,2-mannosyltransferase